MTIQSAFRKLIASTRSGVIHLVPLVLILALSLGALFVFNSYQNQSQESVLAAKKKGAPKYKSYNLKGRVLVKKPNGKTRPYRGKYGKAVVKLEGGKLVIQQSRGPKTVVDREEFLKLCAPADYECALWDAPGKAVIGNYAFAKLPSGTFKISVALQGEAANCFKPLTVDEEFTLKRSMRKNVYVEPTGKCADESSRSTPQPKASTEAIPSPSSSPVSSPVPSGDD